jgi:hypothetical protein
MWDRIILFGLLMFAVTCCATLADTTPHHDTLQDAKPYEPLGAGMRARNAKYSTQCTGTVAQRRACWLEMPL